MWHLFLWVCTARLCLPPGRRAPPQWACFLPSLSAPACSRMATGDLGSRASASVGRYVFEATVAHDSMREKDMLEDMPPPRRPLGCDGVQ